uniref:Uncharacterized protein n=1 Tax=Arundo donax TaxID=35708 RepID=A0A0A9B625_ARUDO
MQFNAISVHLFTCWQYASREEPLHVACSLFLQFSSTRSINSLLGISAHLEQPSRPDIIFNITAPKLNMSNFFEISPLSMYSGGWYPGVPR